MAGGADSFTVAPPLPAPSAMTQPSVFRTAEIEDPSNRWLIHPLSHRAARLFARLGWHPNAVSLLSLPFGLAAAAGLYHYGEPLAVTGGFLALGVWHVLDGADGQLARMTGKSSEAGKVIDGVADYLVNIAVYLALAWALVPALGGAAWAWAVAAGLSHAFQGSLYEYYRYEYDYWGRGVAGRRVPEAAELRAKMASTRGLTRLLHAFHYAYVRAQSLGAGPRPRLHRVLAGRVAEGPAAEDWRARYRVVNRPLVRRWAWLNANKRTLAVYLACLWATPLYYFLWELVILNGVMVACAWAQRRADRRLLAELGGG